jgi:uncharacterized protein (DUF1330 family)
MPKGYWIAHASVKDPARYPEYLAANKKAFAKYGGRFLVRGGAYENPKGTTRERQVVVEFDSYEQAKACFRSPEYQAALRIFETCAESDLVIVEGYDGVQPGDPA